ncbi:hypothetical protein THAOC_05000, partial [Thalassiosira oceanica]
REFLENRDEIWKAEEQENPLEPRNEWIQWPVTVLLCPQVAPNCGRFCVTWRDNPSLGGPRRRNGRNDAKKVDPSSGQHVILLVKRVILSRNCVLAQGVGTPAFVRRVAPLPIYPLPKKHSTTAYIQNPSLHSPVIWDLGHTSLQGAGLGMRVESHRYSQVRDVLAQRRGSVLGQFFSLSLMDLHQYYLAEDIELLSGSEKMGGYHMGGPFHCSGGWSCRHSKWRRWFAVGN